MSKELVPFTEIRGMAQSAHKSGLFPGVRNEEQAYTLMMLAHAEGTHPMQAMLRYDIIEGKPAKKTNAMLADFQSAGGKIKWLERSDKACAAEFHSPHLIEPVIIQWTIDMAKAAGLAHKNNWKSYPRQMLSARVVSEGVQLAMAEVRSLYTPEEVQDFDAKPAYIPPSKEPEYTPPPKSEGATPTRGASAPTTTPTNTAAKTYDPMTPPDWMAGEAAPSVDFDQSTGEVHEDSSSEPFENSVECFEWDKARNEWLSIGHEQKLQHDQLALIHISFKRLEYAEDYRRNRMMELYQKNSSGLLSKREASDLIDRLAKALKLKEGKEARQKEKLKAATADMNQSLGGMGMENLQREPGEDRDEEDELHKTGRL